MDPHTNIEAARNTITPEYVHVLETPSKTSVIPLDTTAATTNT